MTDRLLVDLAAAGEIVISIWPDAGLPEEMARSQLDWPMGDTDLEDLRWYLEDYLRAPFGVYEERGPAIQAKLAVWGEAIFSSAFGSARARDAYLWAKSRPGPVELVFRSAAPELLGLPWELMRDPFGPVVLNLAGVSRTLQTTELAETVSVPGDV